MTYVDESGPSVIVFCIKIIFDLTFFIIVTILGFNIVTAFSEERSEWVGLLSNAILILLHFIQDSIQKHEKERCFICGIENDKFEQAKVYNSKHIVFKNILHTV